MCMRSQPRPPAIFWQRSLKICKNDDLLAQSTNTEAPLCVRDRIVDLRQDERARAASTRGASVLVTDRRLEKHDAESLVCLERCHTFAGNTGHLLQLEPADLGLERGYEPWSLGEQSQSRLTDLRIGSPV